MTACATMALSRRLTSSKRERDFPTVCADSTGTVWLASYYEAPRYDTLIYVDGEYTGEVTSPDVRFVAVNSHSRVFACGGNNEVLLRICLAAAFAGSSVLSLSEISM